MKNKCIMLIVCSIIWMLPRQGKSQSVSDVQSPQQLTNKSLKSYFSDLEQNVVLKSINNDKLLNATTAPSNEELNKRFRDLRKRQQSIRDTIKAAYLSSLDSLAKINNMEISERMDKIKKLKGTLRESVFGLRKLSNIDYTFLYHSLDTKLIRFLPVRNSRFSQLYYEEIEDSTFLKFFQKQFLAFGSNFGAFSSEIGSGYIGPFRISLNSAITETKDAEIDSASVEGMTEEEVKQLVNETNETNQSNSILSNVMAGGGLLSLKAQYPILYIDPLWSRYLRFDSQFIGTLAGEFKSAGNTIPANEIDLWGSYGFENKALIELANETNPTPFGFIFQYNIRQIRGSSKFYEYLEVDGPFWMNEFKAGIYFNGLQISYKYLNFSDKELDGRFQNTISITYAP